MTDATQALNTIQRIRIDLLWQQLIEISDMQNNSMQQSFVGNKRLWTHN